MADHPIYAAGAAAMERAAQQALAKGLTGNQVTQFAQAACEQAMAEWRDHAIRLHAKLELSVKLLLAKMLERPDDAELQSRWASETQFRDWLQPIVDSLPDTSSDD